MQDQRTVPPGTCHCGCGAETSFSREGKRNRYLPNHHRRKSPVAYLEEDRGYETPCWVWQRTLHHTGYGRIGDRGMAHRVIYQQVNGDLPADVHLDHLCRVRACVNPDHLEPVTCAENLRRGSGSKLTVEDVRTIRTSPGTALEMARRFGVSRGTVYHVRANHSWKDVA